MFQDILKGSGRSSVATNLRIKLSQRQKESSRTLADQMADELASVQSSKKIFVFYKGNEYAVTDCVKTSGKALLTTSLEPKDAVRSNWLRSELLQCSGLPVKLEINGKEVDPQDVKNDRILAAKIKKADLDLEDLGDSVDVIATTGVRCLYTDEGKAFLRLLIDQLKANEQEVTVDNIKNAIGGFADGVDTLDLETLEPKQDNEFTAAEDLSPEDRAFKDGLDGLGLDATVELTPSQDVSHYDVKISQDITISQLNKLNELIKATYNITEDPEVNVDADNSTSSISFDVPIKTASKADTEDIKKVIKISDPKNEATEDGSDDETDKDKEVGSGLDDDGYSDDIFLSSLDDLYNKCDWTEVNVETSDVNAYKQLIKSLSSFNGNVVSSPRNNPLASLQTFKTDDELGLREFIAGIKNNRGINLLAKRQDLKSRIKNFFLL